MNIRVLVSGATGRMGQLTVKTLSAHPDFSLVGTTNRTDNLSTEIQKSQAQVVIDFTQAEVALRNTQLIIDAGAHPVIGTSGLMQDQITLLQERCAKLKLGGIIAPNFSLGAILMMKYAQKIVKYFPEVEIIEMHHAGKLDSPSGTAIRTAEMLAEARPSTPSTSSTTHRDTILGARGANYQHVPIHSIRLPGLMAHEQVIFGGAGETLRISYDTIDRQCYMPGVILACQKVIHLDKLVYGLEAIMD
jgi:4-hydroxy-tetrahydrodipicolinate reductase